MIHGSLPYYPIFIFNFSRSLVFCSPQHVREFCFAVSQVISQLEKYMRTINVLHFFFLGDTTESFTESWEVKLIFLTFKAKRKQTLPKWREDFTSSHEVFEKLPGNIQRRPSTALPNGKNLKLVVQSLVKGSAISLLMAVEEFLTFRTCSNCFSSHTS